MHHFEFKAFCRKFEWYVMNSVFSWKGTIQSVFMVLPPPGVARQGFVTSTIWQEICSWKDRPIFPLVKTPGSQMGSPEAAEEGGSLIEDPL